MSMLYRKICSTTDGGFMKIDLEQKEIPIYLKIYKNLKSKIKKMNIQKIQSYRQ